MKKRIIIGLLVLAALLSAVACADTKEQKEIVFGDAGWDSMQFHNAVAMIVAQQAYGYTTKQVSGTTAVTYNALKNGDIDVYMETWQDSIAPYKDDVAKGDVIELGINYADNVQGIYVPRYVIEGDDKRGIEPLAPNLKSVADLKDYSDVFVDPDDPGKGRLYGAISGWAADQIMREKFAFYGLDQTFNYLDPGSDASLAAAIVSAYEKGEPVVAYYWEPAWITGQYDLVLLEDAPYVEDLYLIGQCEFPSIELTVSVNPEFYDRNREFSDEFLKNYQTSSQLTSVALAFLHEQDADYDEAAVWFLKEHDELLDQWLPKAKAELVRDFLARS